MPINQKTQSPISDLVGLVPSAGLATRLGPLPCSKELLPTGFHCKNGKDALQIKVISEYLLEKMCRANASRIFMILREGKWDIPTYFGDGKFLGIPMAYLMMDLPSGVPYTINQAFPFVKDSKVLFGFPDIIFQPEDAFIQLLQKQNESKSDVVLGLFPTHPYHKGDMVSLSPNGRLEGIQVNPESADRGHTWIIAAWTSKFTHFLNDYITERQNSGQGIQTDPSYFSELFMGDVFQAALENDLSTEVVHFQEGRFLDIGHPEILTKVIQMDLMTFR